MPASIVIGTLVSFGFPSAYYFVQKATLERQADVYARRLAARLHDKSPGLWPGETYRNPEIVEELLKSGDIVSIGFRDLSGQLIPSFSYAGPRAGQWLNADPFLGVAPVRFNNRVVGRVEVGVGRDDLMRSVALLFGASAITGSVVATFVFWFPVGVGRAMGQEIRTLVGKTEAINAELSVLLARSVRQHEEAVQLEQVARDITSSLDRVRVLQLVVERTRTLCRADLAWLVAYDDDSETARIVAVAGEGGASLMDLVAQPGRGATGWVLEHERQLCLPSADPTIVDEDEQRAFASERLEAIAMVPLSIRGVPAGILAVATRRERRFDEEMTTMMRLASQAGVALENARMYEERTVVAQEAERRRIAYDLHDGIAQLIVSAKQHLDMCQDMWETDRSRASAELVKGVDRLQQALAETRDILTSLRPSSIEAVGLSAAIRNLLADAGRQQGWTTDFRDRLAGRPLPLAVENALFRIVQEALSNAARHAGAHRVSVELLHDGSRWIEATVRDDGHGFDNRRAQESAHGMGLESMRERARIVGGTVTISSAGRGTLVSARLPLNGAVTW